MNDQSSKWVIVGQGLAGTCLAWEFWQRNVPFTMMDRGHGGCSRIAAGMVNPITGKNFEPSWRIGEFLPDAKAFYKKVENQTGCKIWYDLPVLRLANSEKEWQKIVSKLDDPAVVPWMAKRVQAPDGWTGAVEVHGGGRLDTQVFLDHSREFFTESGCLIIGDVSQNSPHTIWCDGAVGLMQNHFGPHRCAKGEILTVKATGWDETHIRNGAGGWMVPMGDGIFKTGSTYEWDELDERPTEQGRARVEEITRKLGGNEFQIVAHDAGVRPILWQSRPLIGPLPHDGWGFNALGSKGSLYAPGMAERLATWLIHGIAPEATVDLREYLKQEHPNAHK